MAVLTHKVVQPRRTKFKRRCAPRWWLLFILLALGAADAEETVEFKVKAAYLLNFAKFVEWPARKFAAPDSPIIVGVWGQDPFGNILDDTVAGRTVDGRKFQILRITEPDGATNCHILYISLSERLRDARVIPEMQKHHVLTIGESDPFLAEGGIIRFHRHEDKVRFNINPQAAERAGLKISSKLLQLGKNER